MSISDAHIYPYAEVTKMIPDVDKSDISYKSKFLNGFEVKKTTHAPVVVALAAIVLLCALFLTLSAHFAFPLGLNAIGDFSLNAMSNMGLLGKVIGYGVAGLSGAVAAAGVTKWLLVRRQNKQVDGKEQASFDNGITEKIEELLHAPLHSDELLATFDKRKKRMSIFFKAEAGHVEERVFNYRGKSEKALADYCAQNSDISQGKTFVSPKELKQRSSSQS